MLELHTFSDKFKYKRLHEISNPQARNLVAQMLTKDPSKRPTMSQVLAHPFISGGKATRLVGEAAVFDVFISYRVNSDMDLAKALYDLLTGAGLNVWWDKESLKPGEPWQEGFCNGLAQSKIFLPIISRGAINQANNEKQNFSLLTKASPCDNVLLEYQLALELLSRGLLSNLYPVLVGDMRAGTDEYGDYFADGGPPNSVDTVVDSVESQLSEHLSNLCLGTPLLDKMTVKKVMFEINRHQGCVLKGTFSSASKVLLKDVKEMIHSIDTFEAQKRKSVMKKAKAGMKHLAKTSSNTQSISYSTYKKGDNISEAPDEENAVSFFTTNKAVNF